MNDRKICFIACVNDVDFFSECLLYISRLHVPEGYETDVISIEEAKSMTSGYNEGMNASDAKYKIYLHQDTFVIDRYILQEMIDIFTSDPTIGMIGVVGTPQMSDDGCMWNSDRVWAAYNEFNHDVEKCEKYSKPGTYSCTLVEAIDGFFMATQYDIPWREDIFTNFDFYDVSQSKEFTKRGYKVVVPKMGKPICVHDDGIIMDLINYDNNRRKYIKEYCSGEDCFQEKRKVD